MPVRAADIGNLKAYVATSSTLFPPKTQTKRACGDVSSHATLCTAFSYRCPQHFVVVLCLTNLRQTAQALPPCINATIAPL